LLFVPLCQRRIKKKLFKHCLQVHHARDFHREEHCLACGSCFIGARLMQYHVAQNHQPEKIFRDVFIHGYDAPEMFYQCSNCPRSFYDAFDAEHHFFTKHVVMGDCSKDLGRKPAETWCHSYKTFSTSLSLKPHQNKLECLPHARFLQASLMRFCNPPVPVPTISWCVLNHHNLFYQV
jgi:hypothetical protein